VAGEAGVRRASASRNVDAHPCAASANPSSSRFVPAALPSAASASTPSAACVISYPSICSKARRAGSCKRLRPSIDQYRLPSAKDSFSTPVPVGGHTTHRRSMTPEDTGSEKRSASGTADTCREIFICRELLRFVSRRAKKKQRPAVEPFARGRIRGVFLSRIRERVSREESTGERARVLTEDGRRGYLISALGPSSTISTNSPR